MANSTVTAVYRFVIDDVITNVRRDFEDMGVDETIMHELQRSWESKIAQSKVTAQAPEAAAGTDSYPFEEPVYEQSTSAQVPVQAQVPITSAAAPPATYSYKVEPTAAANLANVASTTLPGDSSNVGRPQQHVPPRTSAAGAPGNNISLPGGGRNGTADSSNIPQTDGAADSDMAEIEIMSTAELDAYVEQRFRQAREAEALTGQPGEVTFTLTLSDRAARKAKRDGLEGFDGMIGQVDGAEEEDDDTGLGSDLDDDEEDMDEESANIVLCQYDKVSRTKSKWKCVLKDGIMLINGRDYLFHKANGDFEW
ncbi:transcription factor IIA subunit alpha [Mortierella sp. GBA30]|nr:transcription factor IIA subunit alpha [Mortierella sp. GBA30]